MPEGKAGWVEDQIEGYDLNESIIVSFLKNECKISGTDADFNVRVIQEF